MRKIQFIFYIAFVFILTSCFNIKYSTTGASYGTAKTFTVDFFSNKAPLAPSDIGQKLTESLKDKFTDDTPLDLIGRDGDLLFEGEIVGYDIKPVNIQGDDVAGNMRLTMKVKVTFVNMKAHEWDFSSTISQYIDLSAQQLEANSSQIDELLEKVIDEIFTKSVANW